MLSTGQRSTWWPAFVPLDTACLVSSPGTTFSHSFLMKKTWYVRFGTVPGIQNRAKWEKLNMKSLENKQISNDSDTLALQQRPPSCRVTTTMPCHGQPVMSLQSSHVTTISCHNQLGKSWPICHITTISSCHDHVVMSCPDNPVTSRPPCNATNNLASHDHLVMPRPKCHYPAMSLPSYHATTKRPTIMPCHNQPIMPPPTSRATTSLSSYY